MNLIRVTLPTAQSSFDSMTLPYRERKRSRDDEWDDGILEPIAKVPVTHKICDEDSNDSSKQHYIPTSIPIPQSLKINSTDLPGVYVTCQGTKLDIASCYVHPEDLHKVEAHQCDLSYTYYVASEGSSFRIHPNFSEYVLDGSTFCRLKIDGEDSIICSDITVELIKSATMSINDDRSIKFKMAKWSAVATLVE